MTASGLGMSASGHEGCLPLMPGGVYPLGNHPVDRHPWTDTPWADIPCPVHARIHIFTVNKITDRCKNINFPQFHLRVIIKGYRTLKGVPVRNSGNTKQTKNYTIKTDLSPLKST